MMPAIMRATMRCERTIAVTALLVAGAFAQNAGYTAAPGPHKVAIVDRLVLHDAARNRDIPLKIYYPQAAGPFPVIVFSHGLYGSRNTYQGLGEYWASHGYVSIHPSHEDSLQDGSYRAGLMRAIQDPRLWQSRPQDISFIVSSLAEIERQAPELRGKLDRNRIGVGGHSYGAYTAEAIAGAAVTMPGGKQQSFADARVQAVVVMSPQGEGEMGLTRHSWDAIRGPVLTMYGSRDFGSQRRTPDWRSQPFSYGPGGNKYDVELEGATHMTFVGPRGGSIEGSGGGEPTGRRRLRGRAGGDDKLFDCAKVEALAFWDAFLKQDAAAKQWLDSDALNTFCGGKAKIARK